MIKITDLHKSFNKKRVLKGVNLEINKGETFAIIGPSGCGKSVTLKNIVGLLEPDSGYVEVEGKRVDLLNKEKLYKLRLKFGYLFQGAALFDSMTVGENVILPLVENNIKVKDKSFEEIAEEKLKLVDLPDIQHLKPSELSGGMKKRVGLARALVTDPEYILYDEPTTGLDPVSSDSIDDLIKILAERLNVTSIVVTHDMYSVKNVADRIALMHEGKVHFLGTAEELEKSSDPVIQNFIRRTQK